MLMVENLKQLLKIRRKKYNRLINELNSYFWLFVYCCFCLLLLIAVNSYNCDVC
jgi:hypothetical protein